MKKQFVKPQIEFYHIEHTNIVTDSPILFGEGGGNGSVAGRNRIIIDDYCDEEDDF